MKHAIEFHGRCTILRDKVIVNYGKETISFPRKGTVLYLDYAITSLAIERHIAEAMALATKAIMVKPICGESEGL